MSEETVAPGTSVENALPADLPQPGVQALFDAEKTRLDIALIVTDARKKCGVTQTALARRMKTSQSTIARIEAGRVNITIETFGRIAAALGFRIQISLV